MVGRSCWSASGTRLGPWLFLAMINDLRLPEGFHMWKFADDTTVSEVVPPSKHSSLQQAADFIYDWSQENHLQLNAIECKEIRTGFKRTLTPPPPLCFFQVAIEGVEFEIVSSAKVLGVVISSDLKWSAHIDSITTKAAKRLYLLRQLKRAGIAHSDLVRFYCSVIRSSLNMHARSSIVMYRYISRKKLNAFSVVRYALFFLIVVTVKV